MAGRPHIKRDPTVRLNADDCDRVDMDLCPADFFRRELNTQVQTLIERNGELSGQVKALSARVEGLHEENQVLRSALTDIQAQLRTISANIAPVTAFWSDIGAGKRILLGLLAIVASVGAAVAAYRELMIAVRG